MSIGESRSTHSVTISATSVIKTYRSWDRGEAYREATALGHLQEHAPGLAPALITAYLDDVPPRLVMTRPAGQPRQGPWSAEEIRDLHEAFERLRSVPAAVLPPLPGRPRMTSGTGGR
jgi:hypothetical protein